MPLRQPHQRPIGSDDFTNKSFWFTVTPVANQNSPTSLVSTSSVGKPTLTVSHPMLTFAKTSPGRPTFIILTISQQHTDTPVILSTDAPDHFQLATDSRPVFSSRLTLIPSPTGTYVHVRYAANQMGFHSGKLFIETPYESRTLTLKGSNWSLLPTSYTPQLPVRLAKSTYADRALSSSWPVWLLAITITSGLVWGGYTYGNQLLPSLFPGNGAAHSLTDVNQPNTTPFTRHKSPESTAYTAIELKQSGETKVTQADRRKARNKRSAKQTTSDSLPEKRVVLPPVSLVQKSIFAAKNVRQDDNHQANARPRRRPIGNPVNEESELERELNRNGQQQQAGNN